jgi:hypothetical protein
MVLEGEAERGDEKAELKMAPEGLVSALLNEAALIEAEAGRWVVSGLAIRAVLNDVDDDVRVAVGSERTESMETDESGLDVKAGAGVGVKEVVKGEGCLGREEEEKDLGVEGEDGTEFVVAAGPF